MAKKKASAKTQVDQTPRLPASGGVTQYERYESIVIHRSQIKNAPYNPRTIDRYARQKLEKFIKRAGLLGPPTWNRTTGNICGGHQRISILDALEGTQDYMLTVAAIDVPLVREKEYNIALNNPSLQGTWDTTLLEECLLEIAEENDGNITGTGFDKADLMLFEGFSGEALDSIFGEQDNAEQPIIDQLGEIKDSAREWDKQNSERPPTSAVTNPQIDQPTRQRELTDDELLATKPAEMSAEEHKRWLKLKRANWTAEKNDTSERGDEFYAVIVFNTQGELSGFLTRLQLPTDQRYFAGDAFIQAIQELRIENSK